MKIVVLAGGTSTERSVSITSGTMVCKALREKNHQAVLVDIFCGIEVNGNLEDAFAEENYDVDKAAEYMHSFDEKLDEMIASRRRFFGRNVLELCEAADVVFLALHGANGEDGKVQATFDLLGIPYTGTGYLSSALAMDKSITKQFFRAGGMPGRADRLGGVNDPPYGPGAGGGGLQPADPCQRHAGSGLFGADGRCCPVPSFPGTALRGGYQHHGGAIFCIFDHQTKGAGLICCWKWTRFGEATMGWTWSKA